MKKRLYIAYGSNLNLRQMAMRCPTAKLVGTGVVEDHELQFKGAAYGAFATIGEKPGAAVPVAVWSLQPRDERALDSYEGYPFHYYKEDLPVLMNDGSELTAMVYVMNQRMAFGVPSQRYYNTVYEGYENCGLDVAVLNPAILPTPIATFDISPPATAWKKLRTHGKRCRRPGVSRISYGSLSGIFRCQKTALNVRTT